MRRILLVAAVLALALALTPAGAPAQEAGGGGPGRKEVTSKRMTLEQTVGSEVFQKAGLAKLSAEEQFALADWIRAYTIDITRYAQEQRDRGAASPSPAKP